jgi:2-polyprenyl-3-methyl-5-hydroxy-6-metoxy-1,4-benzoquinol methylase
MTTAESESVAGALSRCPLCASPRLTEMLRAPDRFHGRTELYQLAQCPECTYVRLMNPPEPSQMGEHYGVDYDRAVAAAGKDPNRWRGRWETLAEHKREGAILDLGCSAGGFLEGLKGSSWKLYGIEMSEEVANEARASTGAEVFVGNIEDAPFPPSSFDAITCFHVFEHLYQPREVLAKAYEWLKPGGILYLMVPNIDSAGFKIFRSYWYALELPRHISFFSPQSLRTVAKSVGLTEVSVVTDREVFIEHSTRYLIEDGLRKIGIHRQPLAKARQPGIPFRVVRKAFRLTALPVLNGLASLAGDGESIHAIFRKGNGTH